MSLKRVQDVSVDDIYKREKPRKHYVYFIQVQWQDGPITPVYRSYNTLLELQESLFKMKDFLQNQKKEENSTTFLKGVRFLDRFAIKERAKALRRLPAVEEFLKVVVHLPPHISESDPVINFFHPLPEDLIALDYEQKEIHYSIENMRRGSKSKYIHHISEPILVEQYVVVADYVKREDTDISLKAGNVVDVVEKNEDGWWFVDLDGELGWAPASYLEPRDGTTDDQVLEVFDEGEEETYITMAAYEPQLTDEVTFELGKIVKVFQKNLDGWWFIKFDDKEGWAPSMYMREIATSRHNARQKGQHAVRAMLRDTRLNTISAITGRRQTWDPPKRKKSVKRTIPADGANQTDFSTAANYYQPSYVNLEFHETAKRETAGKGRTRQKLDPNDVRAGAKLQPTNDVRNNSGTSYENADGFLKPRPLSLVEEEAPETVSRGTSPISSPLLRRDSNGSVLHPTSSSEFPDEETGVNAPLPVEVNETERAPIPVDDTSDSQNESKENQDIEDEDEDEDEGKEYAENMPELVNNTKFYAMGTYEKQEEKEVNLRENAEVEVIQEDDGGWWLVRTSSHSVGWAPSNFLEKVQSLRRGEDNSSGNELPGEAVIRDIIPIRPPKSPRIQKMARDMCIEKNFWHYIQKGKDTETCLLNKPDKTPENSSEVGSGNCQPLLATKTNASEVDTGSYQPSQETKENTVKVMAFTFDDYECDPNTGICRRKGRQTEGVKYVPTHKAPVKDDPNDILEVNNVMERSESVPSLAESEDLDDHDYEQIE